MSESILNCLGEIPPTWRIIPGLGYVVNNHGDRKSPFHGVMGPLINGLNGL